MNDDELWAAIDVQRLSTTTCSTELTPEEWNQPSLCEGWTVRDVAAHLTLQQLTLGSALLSALRHPGGTNHIIDASARDRAKQPPDQLIAELRGMVGSRRHVVGLTPMETLIDNVVHGQDIAVPTGRVLEVPPVSRRRPPRGSGATRRPGWAGSSRGCFTAALRGPPARRDRHRLVGRRGTRRSEDRYSRCCSCSQVAR